MPQPTYNILHHNLLLSLKVTNSIDKLRTAAAVLQLLLEVVASCLSEVVALVESSTFEARKLNWDH